MTALQYLRWMYRWNRPRLSVSLNQWSHNNEHI